MISIATIIVLLACMARAQPTIDMANLRNFLNCVRPCDQLYKYTRFGPHSLLVSPTTRRELDERGIDRCMLRCWARYSRLLDIVISDNPDRQEEIDQGTDIDQVEQLFEGEYVRLEDDDDAGSS
jgi:hypothetical protein